MIRDDQPAFLQIAEKIKDSILIGEYQEDERIPSVREMAEMVEVNPNTVSRAYERLQFSDVIYTMRGLGYFVSPGAKEQVAKEREDEFYEELLPYVFKQMIMLDLPMTEVEKLYEIYAKEATKSLKNIPSEAPKDEA